MPQKKTLNQRRFAAKKVLRGKQKAYAKVKGSGAKAAMGTTKGAGLGALAKKYKKKTP
jgi:hypothetical protein